MRPLQIDEFTGAECDVHPHTLDDYEGETPRWCKGCGDHGVLLSVQQSLRELQADPEKVVAVSGIGCSSRLPYYLKTYGFHGIHGRALPISLGVALSRPDLQVLTIMGDGDCFSIGSGHWVHTLRYNPNATVLVLDNEVYALTKKQASPTTRQGGVTNTSPYGAYLKGLNPLSVILGVSNVSFLAQTATWYPMHMQETIRLAWAHKGLSFVRILQRCPVYMPDLFVGGVFAAMFLEAEGGVPVDHTMVRKANILQHDWRDLHAAQKIAVQEDPAPLGLIYRNPDVPTYQEVRYGHSDKVDRKMLISRMNDELDKYTVQLNP